MERPDVETTRMILELQLADLAELAAIKEEPGHTIEEVQRQADSRRATELYRQQLMADIQALQDRAMCESYVRSNTRANILAVANHTQQERQCEADRREAQRLAQLGDHLADLEIRTQAPPLAAISSGGQGARKRPADHPVGAAGARPLAGPSRQGESKIETPATAKRMKALPPIEQGTRKATADQGLTTRASGNPARPSQQSVKTENTNPVRGMKPPPAIEQGARKLTAGQSLDTRDSGNLPRPSQQLVKTENTNPAKGVKAIPAIAQGTGKHTAGHALTTRTSGDVTGPSQQLVKTQDTNPVRGMKAPPAIEQGAQKRTADQALATRAPGNPTSSSQQLVKTEDTNPAKRARKDERQCVACAESYEIDTMMFICNCGHGYCRDCLRQLFSHSITDESLFPPKCCKKEIPVDDCRHLLSVELTAKFRAKKVEFETPNKTYCSSPTCSTFILPQYIRGDVAACVACKTKTCTLCKKAVHDGEDCPTDPSTQALLKLAESEGWKKCASCKRMVELDIGCNHITCRCGYEFCYVCGVQWKNSIQGNINCKCPLFDEARLLLQAVARVGPNIPQAERDRRVQREAQNIRDRHACAHDGGWNRIGGENDCDVCGQTLRCFIHTCDQCGLAACNRCRYNRL